MPKNVVETVKAADVITMLQKGKVVAVAEYRSFAGANTMSGTSEKTGKPYSFSRAEHNVEIGEKPMVLTQVLGDEWKNATKDFEVPFKKGEKVLVEFSLDDRGKGVWGVAATVSHLVEK